MVLQWLRHPFRQYNSTYTQTTYNDETPTDNKMNNIHDPHSGRPHPRRWPHDNLLVGQSDPTRNKQESPKSYMTTICMGKTGSKESPTQHNGESCQSACCAETKTANNTHSVYARDRKWMIPPLKTGARRSSLTSRNISANSHQDYDAPWLRHTENLSRTTGINHSDYGKDSSTPLR